MDSDQPPVPMPGHQGWIISCGRGNTYGHPHQSSLHHHFTSGWGNPIHTSNLGQQPRGDRFV